MEIGIILPSYQNLLTSRSSNLSGDRAPKTKAQREQDSVKAKANNSTAGENTNGRIVNVSI